MSRQYEKQLAVRRICCAKLLRPDSDGIKGFQDRVQKIIIEDAEMSNVPAMSAH